MLLKLVFLGFALYFSGTGGEKKDEKALVSDNCYHYHFIANGDPFIYPIATQFFNVIYFTDYKTRKVYTLKTYNNIKFEKYEKQLPMGISSLINDPDNKSGLFGSVNKGGFILNDRNWSIQISDDMGLRWKEYCSKCVRVDPSYKTSTYYSFNWRFSPFYYEKLSTWIYVSTINGRANITVPRSGSMNKWIVGNAFPDDVSLAMCFIQITEDKDPSNDKLFLVSLSTKDRNLHFRECTIGSNLQAPEITLVGDDHILDYGKDISRAQRLDDGTAMKAKSTLVVWYYNSYGDNEKVGWDGGFGIFREVFFSSIKDSDKIRVYQKPSIIYDSAKWTRLTYTNVKLGMKSTDDIFECFNTNSYVLSAEFNPKIASDSLSFHVRANEDGSNCTMLGYNGAGLFFISRMKSEPDSNFNVDTKYFYENFAARLDVVPTLIQMTVFVDCFLVELCGQNGLIWISALIYSSISHNRAKMVGEKDLIVNKLQILKHNDIKI